MARTAWSDEDKERALLALNDGATLGEVHADTGIPKGTLASWKRRQGEQERAAMLDDLRGADGWAERAQAADQRWLQSLPARMTRQAITANDRAQLAGRLRDEVLGLLDRINAPTTYTHVKVVSQGADAGQTVELVDVDLPLPTAADTKALVSSAALLIDKLQLLTGEATERHEHLGGPLDLEAELELLLRNPPAPIEQAP